MYGRVYRHRDFSWLTAGTTLSFLGDQVGWLGILWWVMVLTGSPLKMGLAGLAYELPVVLVGSFIGAWMHRTSAKRLMILDNGLRGVVWLAIPVLSHFRLMPFGVLCALLAVLGASKSITTVGAMSLVPELIGAEELAQANAWDESLWQAATILGPLIGGVLISLSGPAFAILADGLSCWGVALCIAQVRRPHPLDTVPGRIPPDEGRDALTGLKTLWSLPAVLAITVFAVVINFLYGGLDISLPLFVHRTLHQGGSTLGMLWAAYGVGATAALLRFGRAPQTLQTPSRMGLMLTGMGLCLAVMAWAEATPPVLALMGAAGVFFGSYPVLARTIVQTLVPEALRTHVFGVRSAIIGIGLPSGALFAGALLERLPAPDNIALIGLSFVALGVVVHANRGLFSPGSAKAHGGPPE